MDSEKIIKALGCCLTTSEGDCIACAYRGKKDGLFITCTNCLMADALALINSQEQRIKELAEEIKDLTETVEVRGKVVERLQILTNEIEEDNRKLTEENERLNADNEWLKREVNTNEADYTKVAKTFYNKGKADTVRKMQEEWNELKFLVEGEYYVFAEDLDLIAKEMIDNVGT